MRKMRVTKVLCAMLAMSMVIGSINVSAYADENNGIEVDTELIEMQEDEDFEDITEEISEESEKTEEKDDNKIIESEVNFENDDINDRIDDSEISSEDIIDIDSEERLELDEADDVVHSLYFEDYGNSDYIGEYSSDKNEKNLLFSDEVYEKSNNGKQGYFSQNNTNYILEKIRNAPSKYTIKDFNGKNLNVNLTRYDDNGKEQYVVNMYNGSVQTCFAYANEMFNYLFDRNFSKSQNGAIGLSTGRINLLNDKETYFVGNVGRKDCKTYDEYASKVNELLLKALPGDVVLAVREQYYNDKGNLIPRTFHFMIFMYAEDTNKDGRIDYAYFAEGNVNSDHKIKIESKRSFDYLTKTRGVSFALIRCKDYDKYNTRPHTHSYKCNKGDTIAHCDVSGCNEPKWLESDHKVSAFNSGDYKITTALNLYSGPYSGSNKTGSQIKKDDVAHISKAMTNAFGNIWGYVDQITRSGKKIKVAGWICIKGDGDSDYKFRRNDGGSTTNVEVHFDDMSTPTKEGKFNLKTVITVDNGVIEKVTGDLIDQDNNIVQTASSKGNGTNTLKVYSSAINTGNGCLKFANLRTGKYKYRYTVKVVGESRLFEKESNAFTVGNVVAYEKPAISQAGASVGNIVYRISNNGYKIKYSTDGGKTYNSAENSKDIVINQNTTIKAYTYDRISGKNSLSGEIGTDEETEASAVYVKSDENVKSVTIERVKTPEIKYTQNGDGSTVNIAVYGSYNAIYYKLNNGEYNRYNGPFTITTGATVCAYAENVGMISSDSASQYIQVSKPDTPNIKCTSKADIAEGDAMTINWNNDSKAKSYSINIKKDGSVWKTLTSTSAYCVFNTEGSGIYSVTVTAINAVGNSSASNEVLCEAHDPVTVRFLDWDDSVIGSPQTVRYGYSATKPLTPKRRGYTFSGWEGQYNNVTADTDIKADYEINTYIVKFYDVSGKNYLGEQSIIFDTSIDKDMFADKVIAENAGRHFTGWEIFNVKDDESYLDIEHVDSDMLVRAVTTWTNESFPCLISNVSSSAINVNDQIGFRVNCTVNSTDAKDLKAKIMVSLCCNREDGVYRMIKTSTKETIIKAGTSNAIEPIDVTYDGSVKIDKILVSVVSIEGSDRTGGLIAEPKYYDVPEGSYRYYSGWVTAEEAAAKGYSITGEGVQKRTVYRARVNSRRTTGWTKDSAAPTGFKLLESVKRYGNYSGWSSSYVASTNLRDVETRQVKVDQSHTEYRYGTWTNGSHTFFCPISGKKKFGGSWELKYTGWSKTRTNREMVGTEGNGNFCPYKVYGCTNNEHIGYDYTHNNSAGQKCDYWQYKYHPTSNGDDYYWEQSKWVESSYNKTEYRYRDNYYEYNYYTFDKGWWGEWDTSVLSEVHNSSQDIDVQSRTEYNILLGSVPPTDEVGVVRKTTGSMNDAALSGKTALVLVYKEKNTDPTESQLEYVGETVFDENGGYEIDFITRDEPDYNTGDFVVALAIEGSDNYINVDLVRYERNKYTVRFISDDEVIDEVIVEEGQNAVAPENVEREGYDFVGWDRNITAVKGNINVVAKFKPKKYCVVFVDYENRTCNLTMQNYGSLITLPDDMDIPEHEGYEFDGWDYEEGSTVNDNIVVTAKWTPKTFTVKFMDAYGNTINSQNVSYGCAAEIPTLNVAGTYDFLGWDENESWWNVTKDMEVHPIIINKNKLAAPSSNMEFVSNGEGKCLTLEAEEGADIYYTVDSSSPSVENYNLYLAEDENILLDSVSEILNNEYSVEEDLSDDEFDDGNFFEGRTYKYLNPIVLDEDCIVQAIAVAPDYEDSEIAEFIHSMDPAEVEKGDIKELSKQYVYLNAGEKIKISVDLDSVELLSEIDLLIDAESANIYPAYDEENDPIIKLADKFSESGKLYVNIVDENGKIDFSWVGSEAVINPRNMFTIELLVDEETQSGYYPLSLYYAPKFTSDGDYEPISLEGKVKLNVNAEEDGNNDDEPDEIEKKHSITYELNGGINNSNNPNEYTEGTEVLLRNPKRLDYVFDGWYDNLEFCGDKIEKIPANSKRDIILYAKWIELSGHEGFWAYADVEDYVYTGVAIKPEVSVFWGDDKLVQGTDYTITYQNNIKAASKDSNSAPTITITGKGNYAKAYKLKYDIAQKDLETCDYVDEMKIALNTTVVPVIVCNGVLLNNNDYDMYRINENGLTESIKSSTKWSTGGKLRLVGKGNYNGKVDINVSITDTKPGTVNLTQASDKLYFDEKSILPLITVYAKGDTSKTPLVENEDYVVFYTDDTINAGVHKYVVAGIGRYNGIISKTYTIYPIKKDVSYVEVKTTPNDIVTYNKNGAEFDNISVKYKYLKQIDGAYDYATIDLVEGKDYTVKYANNKKIGNYTAKLTVSFIGNYKGVPTKTVEYCIKEKSIEQAKVLVPDKTNCSEKGVFKQSPIVCIDGIKLSTSDYTVKYFTDENCYFELDSRNNPIVIGDSGYSTVWMTIEGKGNYIGKLKTSYRVYKKGSTLYDLSKAKITIKNHRSIVFENGEIEPEIENVTVGTAMMKSDYYSVNCSVNVYKGTATLMITGDGIHTIGSKTQTFSIGAYDVNNVRIFTSN